MAVPAAGTTAEPFATMFCSVISSVPQATTTLAPSSMAGIVAERVAEVPVTSVASTDAIRLSATAGL